MIFQTYKVQNKVDSSVDVSEAQMVLYGEWLVIEALIALRKLTLQALVFNYLASNHEELRLIC